MFDFGSKIVAGRLRRREMDRRRKPRVPRLDRRNAVKNIDYDVASSSSSWCSSPSASTDFSPTTVRTTRSLDLGGAGDISSQTSFRIGGSVEGEVDLLCRSLGLSGPEDFAIPIAAWEARKAHSGPLILLPPSRLLDSSSPSAPPPDPPDLSTIQIKESENEATNNIRSPVGSGAAGPGIRGVRPPILSPPSSLAPRSTLAPPPPMSRPVLDKSSSTWDILRSFAPDNEDGAGIGEATSSDGEDEEVPDIIRTAQHQVVRMGVAAEDFSGFSTSNDDDSSSTTTETPTPLTISPNGKFRRIIKSWERGTMLGSGSYGTVYEGISDEGIFFAIKEVSLLDQGANAKQCIAQLEQEIALLSQFEHENIVQYLGTDKEEAKLFIFLELVTQGSLVSLYQKYNLRDSQVSAYTRQILNGLKYLHDRKVVHRDIKCANILVHADGSIKLADFGLAKEITKLNVLKSCKGSVYWMAPEVIRPKRTYGPSADIWSLGCTVLEMLTHQIPYPNLEWTQALFRIGRGEKPPIPNSLSKDARDFISQCVQVNPDDRPSAAQLLEHSFVRRSLLASESSESSMHSNDSWT